MKIQQFKKMLYVLMGKGSNTNCQESKIQNFHLGKKELFTHFYILSSTKILKNITKSIYLKGVGILAFFFIILLFILHVLLL